MKRLTQYFLQVRQARNAFLLRRTTRKWVRGMEKASKAGDKLSRLTSALSKTEETPTKLNLWPVTAIFALALCLATCNGEIAYAGDTGKPVPRETVRN